MSTKGEKHENIILNRNHRRNCNFSGADNLYFKGVEKKMSIGENIRAKLKEKKTTAVELAKYCSVSQPTISQIMKGIKTPSIGLTVCIADFFGCTVDELVK